MAPNRDFSDANFKPSLVLYYICLFILRSFPLYESLSTCNFSRQKRGDAGDGDAKLLQLEPLVLCQWRLAGLEHGLLKLAYKVPLTLAASNKGASFYQMTWLIA